MSEIQQKLGDNFAHTNLTREMEAPNLATKLASRLLTVCQEALGDDRFNQLTSYAVGSMVHACQSPQELEQVRAFVDRAGLPDPTRTDEERVNALNTGMFKQP